MPVVQITLSQGRTVEQKRELIKLLTRETAQIIKFEEAVRRTIVYEVSDESWGNAGILGIDMK